MKDGLAHAKAYRTAPNAARWAIAPQKPNAARTLTRVFVVDGRPQVPVEITVGTGDKEKKKVGEVVFMLGSNNQIVEMSAEK